MRAASSGRAGQVRSARSPQGEDERCLTRPEGGAYCLGPLPGYELVGGFGSTRWHWRGARHSFALEGA